MYIIIGLGNPEKGYSNTRHNMGFDTINKLSEKYDISVTKTKFQGIYGKGIIEGQQAILLKPQTYMNLSGRCIEQFVKFYNIPLENVIVIYDDMDLEPGAVKVRKKGGPGNHNGMKSVVEHLRTEEFSRIRIGIGKPEYKEQTISYVIGKIAEQDKEILMQGVEKARQAAIEIIKSGIDNAMNKINKRER